MWLEMSREKDHGGGEWGFGRAVWVPAARENGTTWAYYTLVGRVLADDVIMHLRDEGDGLAFVGSSIAAGDGYETTERPPSLGPWGYATRFFRADLRDFLRFADPIPLRDRLEQAHESLLAYYEQNRARGPQKRTIFYSKFGTGLKGVVGAYFSEMDERLASIFFGADFSGAAGDLRPPAVSARTGESLAAVRRRAGQKAFADNVVKNYGCACCFPTCEVRERALLVGSHIARWADDVGLRGETANGLCFCLLHDRAFEKGWFVLDDGLRVRLNRGHRDIVSSNWARARLAPHEGATIANGAVAPSLDALRAHRDRVRYATE